MPTTSPKSGVMNWIIIGLVVTGGLLYLAYNHKLGEPAAAKQAAAEPILASPAAAGRVAPNWTLDDVTGKPVSLQQYAGHPVVLDFWATWCGPCQVEMPWWQQFQKQYASQGLVIVGISEDEKVSDVQGFLKKNPLDYQVVFDGGAMPASYGTVLGLPTTIYINRQGKITQVVAGLEGKPEIDKAIHGIL